MHSTPLRIPSGLLLVPSNLFVASLKRRSKLGPSCGMFPCKLRHLQQLPDRRGESESLLSSLSASQLHHELEKPIVQGLDVLLIYLLPLELRKLLSPRDNRTVGLRQLRQVWGAEMHHMPPIVLPRLMRWFRP